MPGTGMALVMLLVGNFLLLPGPDPRHALLEHADKLLCEVQFFASQSIYTSLNMFSSKKWNELHKKPL